MGLDENLFDFIFQTAKKPKKKIKSEDEFREKIKSMSSSFEDAVSDMISDIVLDNIDYLADIIIKNNPHELAAKDANVLEMLLSSNKARGIIEGARKQKRFIKWDTKKILDAIIIVLGDKGIVFDRNETIWLARNIHAVGQYIYG
jgi:hypothetical protein